MTQTTRYKLSRPEEYIKNGETRTSWSSVGTLTYIKKEDGSETRIVEIPTIGLQAFAFPFDDTTNNSPFSQPQEEHVSTEEPKDTGSKDEIEEIPF